MVPLVSNVPRTEDQSQPTIGKPEHWGGHDSATAPRQSSGLSPPMTVPIPETTPEAAGIEVGFDRLPAGSRVDGDVGAAPGRGEDQRGEDGDLHPGTTGGHRLRFLTKPRCECQRGP